jgi:hypothetical protein
MNADDRPIVLRAPVPGTVLEVACDFFIISTP